MTIFLVLTLFVVLFMLFVSLVIMVIGPVMLLQPHRRTEEYYARIASPLHPAALGLPYEDMILKTTEGISLSCWFIKGPASARGTIIYLHGVSECKIVGLPLAKEFHDQGYHVFLYDSRRHGNSGGKFCTYGFYEKHDVYTIINYLQTRKDVAVGHIGLFGTSMGAAIALQVAAIDRRVVAVVAESGFATLRSIFDDYQKRMIKLPWHYLRNIVIKRSESLADFKANSVSPLQAVKDIHIPLFILHGTSDTLIKYSYSEQIYMSANDPKELWLLPGARHDNMSEVGQDEYKTRILAFFDKHLTV